MDEDLRGRYRSGRRDYSEPVPRPYRPPVRHVQVPPPAAAPHQAYGQPQTNPPNPFQPNPPAYRPPQPAPAPPPDSNTASRTQQPHVYHKKHGPKQPNAHQQPQQFAHPRPRPVKQHRFLRSAVKIFIILAILGGLAAGGYLWAYPKYFPHNPFNANIQTNAGMPLLYPNKLPAGFQVDATSMKMANGVVAYAATKGSTRLVFTLQKTPPAFDFGVFYKDQLKNSQQFTTQYGEAIIGRNDNRYLGSLVAGSTWLLLSTNSPDITYDQMSLVMHNLKKF